MKKIMLFICLLSGIFEYSNAQPLLTAGEAVSIALKNNFDILIARNDADIDSINNTAGNAGMLPSFALSGTDNFAVNFINQKSQTGVVTNYANSSSNSLNIGPLLNWTLFDGGKMFVTKRRLQEIEALGELQFKDQVMQTEYNIIVAYYDVVRQKQQLTAINEVIAYNLDNVKILQVSFDAGMTPKTNLLLAEIDLNVYQENALSQKSVILSSKRTLNGLLGRDVETDFDVPDTVPLSYNPDPKELAQKLYSTNTSVLAAQKQIDVANLVIKENRSGVYPRISASAGYFLSLSNNPAGSSLSYNNNYGPQLGATVTVPLFQAGNVVRQVKTAKLQMMSAQDTYENVKIQVNMQLQNALTDFQNQQQLLKIEKDNSLLARKNLEISTQRLRCGQTTSLEVHQAQESYVQSLTRLVNFEYNLKVAETRLKQLMAEL